MDTPIPDPGPDRPLVNRIEERLALLDEVDLAGHPAAYEAMDEAVRAELEDLEQLAGERDG